MNASARSAARTANAPSLMPQATPLKANHALPQPHAAAAKPRKLAVMVVNALAQANVAALPAVSALPNAARERHAAMVVNASAQQAAAQAAVAVLTASAPKIPLTSNEL